VSIHRERRRNHLQAKYGLHALRHAAAALFIEQGFSPKRIKTILSHASIKMTYHVYGYLFVSEEHDQAAMAQIEARLLGS
jgi:integrase